MFSSIGVPGLIVILIIVLILFGPKKLPEIGGAVGKTLAEFKRSTKGIMDDDETPAQKPAQTTIQPPLPTPVEVTAAEEKKSETL